MTEVAPLASFLPPPETKRADLLNLKLRLAAVLSKEAGLTYWNALIQFCTGKLNRIEFGIILEGVLGRDTEAGELCSIRC